MIENSGETAAPKPQPNSLRALFVGGLLPVVLFTVVEEVYGTLAGLIVGMAWGIGEILYEKIRFKKVDPITWGGNGLLLVLGGVSLFTNEGIWFKLQPSILELVMGGAMIVSWAMKKPLLPLMLKKQGLFEKFPEPLRPLLWQAYSGITFRAGLFLLAHSALAAWAALYWSTKAWAMLKGLGFTLSFIAYLVLEAIFVRQKIKRTFLSSASTNAGSGPR